MKSTTRRTRYAAVAGALLAAGAVLAAGAGPVAGARGHGKPSFSTDPTAAPLTPSFGWQRLDYAVRCDGQRLAIQIDGAPGWSSRVAGGKLREGSYDVERPLAYDQGMTIAFKRNDGAAPPRRFHLRCLPADFPSFDFERLRPGGTRLFATQMDPYAVIMDSDGAPIWWFDTHKRPNDVEVLPDRTIAWNPIGGLGTEPKKAEIRRLDGRLVREVSAVDGQTDLHELLLLPNGNYLLGGRVIEHHVDTSRFGGSPDADVTEEEVQEVTPGGKLVWKWDSADHIRIGETPQRWWDRFALVTGQPYDAVHWNAAEPDGKHMLLSFRHLDAVYEINRRTGNVVWKLGGTPTRKSLRVLGDPEGAYPFGGQHDVRVLPDGTITVHDNASFLDRPPRAVRYRVNPTAMTARLVSSLTDPQIPSSYCCGSARMSPDGDWLVDWGGNPVTAAYDAKGRPLYRLVLASGASYRSTPVPPGLVTPADLRDGMDAMQP